MPDDALAPELLDLVYGAALGQNTWQDILAALERAFPGVRFVLWGHDLRTRRDLGILHEGNDPHSKDSWIRCHSSGGASPDYRRAPIGVPQFAQQLLPPEDMLSREYCDDRVQREGDMLTSMGLTMYADADRFFALSASIGAQNGDPRKSTLERLLKQLGPHLARSFALTRAIQQSIRPHELEMAIEPIGAGLLLLDGRGRVLARNPVARQLLSDNSAVFVDPVGQLRFASAAARRQMERLLLKVANFDYFRLPDTILVEDDRTQARLCLRMVPFRSSSVEPDPAVAFTAPDRPTMLVCMKIEATEPEQRAAQLLMQRFRLTRIECDLALAVCRGETPNAVASRRQVSIHTVRNQLRSIFVKTGAASQSRLVALVWGLATGTQN